MRLETLEELRSAQRERTQLPPAIDSSQYAKVPRPMPWAAALCKIIVTKIKTTLAYSVVTRKQAPLLADLGFPFSFPFDFCYLGYRYGEELASLTFSKLAKRNPGHRILEVGCNAGYESHRWLRRSPRVFAGVDLYSFKEYWRKLRSELSSRYRCSVEFHQAVVERLPFEDDYFEVIYSQAVLEHVRNVDEGIREVTRVLAPGGLVWHQFGPLYFTYGGDHCISAYGKATGYDHLLLENSEYLQRVHDLEFYKSRGDDPDASYWARENQFSFLRPKEYLDIFKKHLEVKCVMVSISEEGLQFRKDCPRKWEALLAGGMLQEDLLVQGMHVILQKSRP